MQEAQNHHMLKYVQGKDISDITPHGQSYQNSPVHFNILAGLSILFEKRVLNIKIELGTSTTPIKQMPGLFEVEYQSRMMMIKLFLFRTL